MIAEDGPPLALPAAPRKRRLMATKTKMVKCNKCEYVGAEAEFPKGRDFLQSLYIARCPKCDNRQSPGGASLRMMPGQEHPFIYVDRAPPRTNDALDVTLHNASEAS